MLRGTAHAPRYGLYDGIKALVRSLIDVIRTRVELLSVEIAEEKARLFALLGLILCAWICLTLGLVFTGFFAVLLSWDTPYRLWVAGLIPAIFLISSVLVAWIIYQRLRSGARLFSATVREMARDVELLTRQNERGS